MQAVSHFHSELGLFMMFLEICYIVYLDELSNRLNNFVAFIHTL